LVQANLIPVGQLAMKRSDRRDASQDNALNNPKPKAPEPVSSHERNALVMTLRANVKAAEQAKQELTHQVQETQKLYQEEQARYQSALVLYEEAQTYQPLYQEERAKNTTLLFQFEETNQKFQQYFNLYNEEKVQNQNLILQVQAAQADGEKYLTLYNESQTQLRAERKSKAGIKGWETRRKKENERLKQEIAEMMVILRDSMERKEEAISNLENLAERMDRIQSLVDSVEDDSTNASPLGVVSKFKRIWRAIQDILAE
jgi:chromosome segregation ATPase